MAELLRIREQNVKVRQPWGVFFLSLVTFGIYYLVWYYKTNNELRRFGIDVSPGIAVLAISLGGLLLIPPFVSQWRFYKRIGRAQQDAGMHDRISHVTGFVLYLVALIFLPLEVVYAQYHLNRLWRHLDDEQNRERAGMRGQAPVA